METITLYKEKWKPIQKQLKEKLNNGSMRIPSTKLSTDIYMESMDTDVDYKTILKREFEKTIEMSNSDDADTIALCYQRMADLCLSCNYGLAGAWLGMFSEEVVENMVDAQYWYNRAASCKCGIGMYRVGLLYLNKKVPLPRTTNLKRCFTDAVSYGVAEAQQVLDEFFSENSSESKQGVVKTGNDTHLSIIVDQLLSNGCIEKYLPSSKNNASVSEVVSLADDVCLKIYKEISSVADEFGSAIFFMYLIWCAYAGMGAVYLWKQDSKKLLQKGAFETLAGARGCDCMDEYVTDIIGIKFGSADSDDLVEHLKRQARIAANSIDIHKYSQVLEAGKAMYMYGMAFEMYRCGLAG